MSHSKSSTSVERLVLWQADDRRNLVRRRLEQNPGEIADPPSAPRRSRLSEHRKAKAPLAAPRRRVGGDRPARSPFVAALASALSLRLVVGRVLVSGLVFGVSRCRFGRALASFLLARRLLRVGLGSRARWLQSAPTSAGASPATLSRPATSACLGEGERDHRLSVGGAVRPRFAATSSGGPERRGRDRPAAIDPSVASVGEAGAT